MSSTSAIAPRCRSSGVATRARHDLGLAPGKLRRDEDGRARRCAAAARPAASRRPAMPHSATPRVSRVVATGRAMKGAEMFTSAPLAAGAGLRRRLAAAPPPRSAPPCGRSQVDHRRGEQRQHLAHQQAADDAEPSGWRSSEPVPVPNISGRAPNMAATVVIRIGRKRSRQAW